MPPVTLTATNDPLDSEKQFSVFLRTYVLSGEEVSHNLAIPTSLSHW